MEILRGSMVMVRLNTHVTLSGVIRVRKLELAMCGMMYYRVMYDVSIGINHRKNNDWLCGYRILGTCASGIISW